MTVLLAAIRASVKRAFVADSTLPETAPALARDDDPAAQAPEAARRDLSELYRLHWLELVRFIARTFGPGPPEPEDAAQAAFEHYAALPRPGLVGNPRAFLYRSARNHVLDQKRRRKVRARFALSADAEQFARATDELHAERVLSAKERLTILSAAIRSLEPRLRDVLILRRIHELSFKEVARRKGISETQAKRLVGMAVLACERALREADSDE